MATRHIGIIGASPEGASLFFRQVARHAAKLLAPENHPVVTLHNERLAEYIQAIHHHDWIAVGRLLSKSAGVLARSGAEFCVIPDQAVIHALSLAQTGAPVPLVNPATLVAQSVQTAGHKHVGLIGTKLVMQGAAYQTMLGLRGIRVEIPSEFECDTLETIIFEELIYGHFKPSSQSAVVSIVNGLAKRGCEGVILGCSEAPLVVTAENCPIRIYDAVDILAEQTVRIAMSEAPIPTGMG